jgi:hypothetical protein
VLDVYVFIHIYERVSVMLALRYCESVSGANVAHLYFLAVDIELEAVLGAYNQCRLTGFPGDRARFAYLHVVQVESGVLAVEPEHLRSGLIVVERKLDVHPVLLAGERGGTEHQGEHADHNAFACHNCPQYQSYQSFDARVPQMVANYLE